MLLSFDEIFSLTQGSLRHEVRDGRLCLYRFTPAQEQNNVRRGQEKKNDSTAGMRLEMTTDAEHLRLAYSIVPGSGRNWYGLDLLVNGLNVQSVYEETNETTGVLEAVLPPGEKKVTIYLSNLCGCRIESLSLDGAFAPVPKKKKILILGDSITQGYDARHPYLSYANMITDAFDAECLNQAVGGEIFCEDNLDEALPFAADMAIVAYGTNDWYRTENLFDAADAYFRKLKRIVRGPVYALLPIWRVGTDDRGDKNPWGRTLENVREQVRAAAEKNGAVALDGKGFVPHVSYYYADGSLHPNDLGFMFYAQNLLKVLKNAELPPDFS